MADPARPPCRLDVDAMLREIMAGKLTASEAARKYGCAPTNVGRHLARRGLVAPKRGSAVVVDNDKLVERLTEAAGGLPTGHVERLIVKLKDMIA